LSHSKYKRNTIESALSKFVFSVNELNKISGHHHELSLSYCELCAAVANGGWWLELEFCYTTGVQ